MLSLARGKLLYIFANLKIDFMKKIITSLAVVLVVVAIATGATMSYFTDTETTQGNTFTAGLLDLKVNGNAISGWQDDEDFGKGAIVLAEGPYAPGETGTMKFRYKNFGSIAGNPSFELVSVDDYENDYTDPEKEAGDTTGGANKGELSDQLKMRLWVDTNGNGKYDDGVDDSLAYNTMSAFVGWHGIFNGYILEKNDTWDLYVDIEFLVGNDNSKAMTDSVGLNIDLDLTQYVAPEPTGTGGDGWDTANNSQHWTAKARHGGAGGYDLEIGYGSGSRDQSSHTVITDADNGVTHEFTLAYVAGTGMASLSLDGSTVTYAVDPVDDGLIGLTAKAPKTGSTVSVANLKVNGSSIAGTDSVSDDSASGYHYLDISNVDMSSDWTLTGDLTITWSGSVSDETGVEFHVEDES